MKKLLLFAISLVVFFLPTSAQIDFETEIMKGTTLLLRKGQKLTYGVDYQGKQYDFIVTIKSLKNGIKFNYEMTNPSATTGKVWITEEAMTLDNPPQYNYFRGGKITLEKQTTVWVGYKIFEKLIKKGYCSVSPDGGESYVELKNARAGHDFKAYNSIAGEEMTEISYVHAAAEDGSAEYWIHLSKGNPLILKMDIGWKIWLKDFGE